MKWGKYITTVLQKFNILQKIQNILQIIQEYEIQDLLIAFLLFYNILVTVIFIRKTIYIITCFSNGYTQTYNVN